MLAATLIVPTQAFHSGRLVRTMTHSFRSGRYLYHSSSNEDIMVKKVLQTHSPDGRHIDPEPILQVVEDIMGHATAAKVSKEHLTGSQTDNKHKAAIQGVQNSLGLTIYNLSHEIMCKCFGDGNSHSTTMMLFDSLGNYSWDAKVVLVLAAFAMSYGELFLTAQFYPINPLAASVAMLTQLPNNVEDTEALKPLLNALSYLVKILVDVTKCIIEFEGLPMQYTTLDIEAMATTKTHIHIAAYWVIKSVVACSSQIAELIAVNHEKLDHPELLTNVKLRQMNSIGVTWELWSLVNKVINVHGLLRKQLDICYEHTEAKVHEKLMQLFKDTHEDNQKVLGTLLSLKDDLPLWDGFTQGQFGVDALRNKIVILFISNLDISLEHLLLIMQQTYDHPHEEERSYEIVWIPIPNPIHSWDFGQQKAFYQVASSFPWYSICQPWLLSLAVVYYITEMWHFKGEPLMVVLDQQGRIICPNAIDMVLIWGDMAYPFSNSREEQLWENASWTLELLMDNIDPVMSMWIKEGRTICLYGSNNLEWIREFTNMIKNITSSGVSLEMIYVGHSNLGGHLGDITSAIAQEKLSGYLSQTKMQFFWIRLKRMINSKSHLRKDIQNDRVMKEVTSLLSLDTREEGWVVMGEGSSIETITLHGRKLMECLALFQIWGDHIEKVGFLGAIRKALDPLPHVEHCNQFRIIPHADDSKEGAVICEECKRAMSKHILYQCRVTG